MMTMKTYLKPLRSNFEGMRNCWVFRKNRPERIKRSTLPDPKEVRLRMEIALTKADIARPEWEHAQQQKQILARIALLEERIAGY